MEPKAQAASDPRDWTDDAVAARIRQLKNRLGRDVLILAHHYQRDAVVAVADAVGDSLKLAQAAAATSARHIVFCGVHFMAETADILTGPDQAVYLPEQRAGCSMADMATPEALEWAWESLTRAEAGPVIPITYVNSAASLKAFVGRHGGAVCTSSNARNILIWALSQEAKVFFFPDEHLGRITAHDLGVPLPDMLVWDRGLPLGGLDPEAVRAARVYLWNGFCVVHQMFFPEDAAAWRQKEPGIRVIVHPECPIEVIREADAYGSTEMIARTIDAAPAGSKWAVGTEINLVARLADRNPDKLVVSLSPHQAICANMYRTRPLSVLRVLEGVAAGEPPPVVRVPVSVAGEARLALDRMLTLS
ncbi:Quinolinate synthetase [Desulfovibrio sp. DV]|uniref:quinolinate synthase NadA n=1 Tax=Desulfovibrio sp. DV TaxID=1844708 RepID=UPI00094BC07F|nr:quinolinate synthase NadA [Desulfovibrio sp. DV]OLN30712.1 Quinolinate synthetase [Desulfovibrio sp. DV]